MTSVVDCWSEGSLSTHNNRANKGEYSIYTTCNNNKSFLSSQYPICGEVIFFLELTEILL